MLYIGIQLTNVMRVSRFLSAIVVPTCIIVLLVILVVRSPGIFSAKNLPITFHNYDVISGHTAPPSIVYGAHNFRQLKRVITEYDDDVAARLATLVERRSTAADPDLIRLIVDMLDPPSAHMVKMSRPLLDTPQSREVDKILKQKVKTATQLCLKQRANFETVYGTARNYKDRF